MNIETNKEVSNGADPAVKPADPDLAEQAVPGHGVPSQDPAATAQFGLSPEEERESKFVLVGGWPGDRFGYKRSRGRCRCGPGRDFGRRHAGCRCWRGWQWRRRRAGKYKKQVH